MFHGFRTYRPRQRPELPGDDGTFEPAIKWFPAGVLAPVGMLVLAGRVIYQGGLTLGGGRHGPSMFFDGPGVVLGAVAAMLGVALLLVARYFLPNVFRTSYSYLYFAMAGVALVAMGMVTFVISALL